MLIKTIKTTCTVCKNNHIASVFLIFCCFFGTAAWSANPIIPNKGANDPHIRIFNDTAYLYASHDTSVDNPKFIMEDWWIWSSKDLVNWTLESVLKPEDTYIGKPVKNAWATDAAYKNGKYYWYFSEGNHQTGVVVGPSPTGPWQDPLGKPFLATDLTSTHEYDISLHEENGEHYVIFGVWQFYIAKLNEDMISLAEQPKRIQINNPIGPYGRGTTDDKPFLHKYNDQYYLSWGAFYAISDDLYGPYEYVDRIFKDHSFAPGYDKPTWPHGYFQGRHGSYFEWHNQWYYAYCDISQSSNRYFRDTFISYVHYRDDGTIAPIRVDGIGVGEYDATQEWIEAEDYFKAYNTVKVDMGNDAFSVSPNSKDNYLTYPKIRNLKGKNRIQLRVHSKIPESFTIQIYRENPEGDLLASDTFKTKGKHKHRKISLPLSDLSNKEDISIVIDNTSVSIDAFRFK